MTSSISEELEARGDVGMGGRCGWWKKGCVEWECGSGDVEECDGGCGGRETELEDEFRA
jgi:hypothetical protein